MLEEEKTYETDRCHTGDRRDHRRDRLAIVKGAKAEELQRLFDQY